MGAAAKIYQPLQSSSGSFRKGLGDYKGPPLRKVFGKRPRELMLPGLLHSQSSVCQALSP